MSSSVVSMRAPCSRTAPSYLRPRVVPGDAQSVAARPRCVVAEDAQWRPGQRAASPGTCAERPRGPGVARPRPRRPLPCRGLGRGGHDRQLPLVIDERRRGAQHAAAGQDRRDRDQALSGLAHPRRDAAHAQAILARHAHTVGPRAATARRNPGPGSLAVCLPASAQPSPESRPQPPAPPGDDRLPANPAPPPPKTRPTSPAQPPRTKGAEGPPRPVPGGSRTFVTSGVTATTPTTTTRSPPHPSPGSGSGTDQHPNRHKTPGRLPAQSSPQPGSRPCSYNILPLTTASQFKAMTCSQPIRPRRAESQFKRHALKQSTKLQHLSSEPQRCRN